jgi:hypothetical protein
MKRVDLTSRLR